MLIEWKNAQREIEFFLTWPLAYAGCEYLQIWLFNK